MGDVGSDGFLGWEKPGAESDRLNDCSDQCGERQPVKSKATPPKAPGGVRAYSSDQPTGIWRYCGDSERKGKDTKGKDHKGKYPKRKAPEGKDSHGKDSKGIRDSKDDDMEVGKAESSQRGKGAVVHYYSNTTRGELRTDGREGARQYRAYISSKGDWQYRDGAWREMRDQADSEIDVADGRRATVDFGEHSDKTYGELLTKNPKYVA